MREILDDQFIPQPDAPPKRPWLYWLCTAYAILWCAQHIGFISWYHIFNAPSFRYAEPAFFQKYIGVFVPLLTALYFVGILLWWKRYPAGRRALLTLIALYALTDAYDIFDRGYLIDTPPDWVEIVRVPTEFAFCFAATRPSVKGVFSPPAPETPDPPRTNS